MEEGSRTVPYGPKSAPESWRRHEDLERLGLTRQVLPLTQLDVASLELRNTPGSLIQMAKQPSRLFDAFALCGLGSDALVSLLGDEGIQAGPSARYRPSLLDRIPRATEGSEASCMAIPQHFPTVNQCLTVALWPSGEAPVVLCV